MQGFSLQDREPNLDLIGPGGACRGEVEMHVRVTLEPAIVLGLVGAEVVEDHINCSIRAVGDDIVHEIEEFDAPSAIFVSGRDLTGGHLEGRKQCRSIAPVVVTVRRQSPAPFIAALGSAAAWWRGRSRSVYRGCPVTTRAWCCADLVAKLKPQIPYFVGQATQRVLGAIMMRRAIALVLSCAALSGCGAIPSMPSFSLPSVKMPSFSGPGAPGTPVHVTSVPPGAEASFGKGTVALRPVR